MNESELRALLDKLEASRLPLHDNLHFFTWLVIVGLAVDLVVILIEFWDDWKEYKRARIHGYSPIRPSFVLLAFGFLGTALIVLGVRGELRVDVQLTKLETDIKVANDQLLSLIITEAGDAKQSATIANDAATKAKDASVSAVSTANGARLEANKVSGRAAELTQKLAEDERSVTELEAKRLELEKSLVNLAVCTAPRVIPQWFMANSPEGGMPLQKTALDPLRPYKGWQFALEYIPFDGEARRAAVNIDAALTAAGWNRTKLAVVDGINYGVEVRSYLSPKLPGYWGSVDAGEVLIDFLHSYNWEATPGLASDTDPDIPPNGIKIRVGPYPAVSFVSPPATKEINAAIEQRIRESEEMRKKDEEKRLEHATPEERARFEEFRNKREQEDKRHQNVCQSLDSLLPR